MRRFDRRGLARSAAIGVVAGALAVMAAPGALAAPGDWTQLSAFSAATNLPKMANIDEPTAARFGSSLQVVWSGQGTSGSNYYTAIVDGSGHVSTAVHEIISNWAGVTDNPALIELNGQRFLGFSGLQSTTTGAPYTVGAEYYATSPDGQTFTVGAGSLSAATTAYAAYGNDVVNNAGTPVWVGNAGTTSGVSWHSGIAATDPAPAGSDGHVGLTGCCAYSAAGARDQTTGAVYAAFYSNSSGTSEQGIQVGQILPTQGAFSQAPGSVTTNDYGTNSISPDQRVAMTSRPGGGVYVAYGMGYPTLSGIRILEVGTGRTMDVSTTGRVGRLALTSDPAGRLWLVYAQDNRIKAIHTNTTATALGATGSWGAPRGIDTLWHTAAVGSGGGLDVVISSNGSDGKINVWHTQALRTLSIELASTHGPALRSRNVTFLVSDAGDPVSGAKVRFAGQTATTNAAGKVTMVAPSAHRKGKLSAAASKAGYNDGLLKVRVR
jgi:hypothetical protein